MADSKITALTSISTSTDPANDPLVIVDVSDTSMAASGTTKKVTLNNLLACSPTATLASATITGDLTVATDRLKVVTGSTAIQTGATTQLQVGTTSWPSTVIGKSGSRSLFGNAGEVIIWNETAAAIGNYSTLFVTAKTGAGATTMGGLQIRAGIENASNSDGFVSLWTSNNTAGGFVERYKIDSTGVSTWSVGGSTAMTLNSTGLGVGGSPTEKLTINNTLGAVTGGIRVYANDQSIARIAVQNTNGQAWHLVAGNPGANNQGFGIYDYTNSATRMYIDTSGNVGIGVTPSAGKGCLQLSSGINFPATQVASSDANTLDDYEEGTFTPTIVGATTAGVGTYSNQNGFYTKVGRLVTITVYLNWTAHTGTGDMRFGNFPFASANVAGNYNGINIAFLNNIALTASNVLYGSIPFGFTYAAALQCPVGGGAASAVPIDTAGEIAFTATYFV